MGRQYHSSITRVRPFFQPLLQRDPTGVSWLPALLRLGQADPDRGQRLAKKSGPLLDWVARPKKRADRALRSFGIESVDLEECFEHRLPPPGEFLRWLIENPHTLVWPRDEEMPGATGRRREELFGHHGFGKQKDAQGQAIAELKRVGAAGSNGKWWAFEGFTHVDCLLETQTLILLVEGKRMEPVSAATRWFPQRNQLMRNLDVARAVAKERGKDYALIMIAEEYIQGMTFEAGLASLPHLTPKVRCDLQDHYLGCVTWSQALAQMFFPHTVEEAARRMRGEMAMAS